jgi:uncharacterized damage-inducible protein DinB
MKSHFAMFARYNRWANQRLYAAAEKLSDAAYRADKGAFFGSIHGTLNHLLVADQIWMRRFSGAGPTHVGLDTVLHEELALLREARAGEDKRIVAFIDGLSEHALASMFSYVTITNPKTVTQRLAPALAHFFNHQTHHRGQAHAILTAVGGRDAAPSIDLIYFQRETGFGND